MSTKFLQERKRFPILKDKIQLSSCSQSAMHEEVKESIDNYIYSWEHYGMDWGGWMETCEDARFEFAKMINADVDEVAIVSSVSHAISSIATSLSVKEKNKVYITDFDFPTMGHVWLSHKYKFDVQFMGDYERDFIQGSDYEKQISNDTLLVNTSHVSFYDGHKQDLKKVSEVVHDKGSLLLVDAYQSLGQVNIDVKEMNIDILTSGLQKYALGIPGIALLYIKREIAETLTPKITGWFGQDDPFIFDIKDINYAKATRRFDSGTFPMINGFAAVSGLKLINKYKIADIESYLEKLSQFTIERAQYHGMQIGSPPKLSEKASNTAIYTKNASKIEQQLSEKGIFVSARSDVIRIAPHFYNTTDDIKVAIEELAKLV